MLEHALPRAVPVARDSRGIVCDLPQVSIESEQVPADIAQPFELVGIDALIANTDITTQGVWLPTVDDILVKIEANTDQRVTSQVRRGFQQPAGVAQGFVPLRSILTGVRMFGHEFREPSPDLSFQFRWAIDRTAAGTQITRIFLTLLTRPIS